MIPAFVFFFQMLYPFALGERSGRSNAPAAAGGCMLVRREALAAAGGIAAIRSALIDDCALGAADEGARADLARPDRPRPLSIRPYPGLGDIRRMVARSAYAQLRYSPLLLAGTLAGMALIYPGAAAACALLARRRRIWIGAAIAWALMALAFQPMLRFYRARRCGGWPCRSSASYMRCSRCNSGSPALARARRHVEGPRPGEGR